MGTIRIMPPQKLITCILPHGVALDVLQRLKDEKGIIEASMNSARGMGRLTPLAHRGVGEQSEKDILNVSCQPPRPMKYLSTSTTSPVLIAPMADSYI